MDAYIKLKADKNKSRYGKLIPKYETRIDIKKFFGRDDTGFINSLKNDKDIDIKLVKSAGISERNRAIEIEGK